MPKTKVKQVKLPRLTAYEFAIGILTALARDGAKYIVPPELNLASDAAAAAAFQCLKKEFAEAFDLRFTIVTNRIYGDSPDWRQALHECGQARIVTPDHILRLLKLDTGFLEYLTTTIPGTRYMWDRLGEVYAEICPFR